MPRIFTKKSFEFRNNEGGVVMTSPLAFHTVLDWCAEDQMFKWAVADGDIEVIADKSKQKQVEKEQK